MQVLIRRAKISDLQSINEIYNQAAQEKGLTADIDPVTYAERKKWFKSHDKDHPVFVAEEKGKVIGWVSLSAYRPGRRALRYTAEISYYLHRDHQQQGKGSKLMKHAIDIAPCYGIKTLFAILLETNIASIKLLEKFDFKRWAHLPEVADIDGAEVGQYYYGRRV